MYISINISCLDIIHCLVFFQNAALFRFENKIFRSFEEKQGGLLEIIKKMNNVQKFVLLVKLQIFI
jgi:hypothetical protein